MRLEVGIGADAGPTNGSSGAQHIYTTSLPAHTNYTKPLCALKAGMQQSKTCRYTASEGSRKVPALWRTDFGGWEAGMWAWGLRYTASWRWNLLFLRSGEDDKVIGRLAVVMWQGFGSWKRWL